MKLGYVIHYVPDVAATVAFYEAAFGVPARLVHPSGVWAELDTGATALAFAAEALVEGDGARFTRTRPEALPPGMEVAFVTEDVAAAFDRAVAAGAEPLAPPAAKPWGQTVAYVRDVNGALVELCTPME